MASNNECCCLCRMCFDGVSSVKKRKRLHGPKASAELSVLTSINRPLATSLEFQRGYLCAICQRKLLKVKRLREELQTVLEEIKSKLSNAVQSTCKFYINGEHSSKYYYFIFIIATVLCGAKRASETSNSVSKRARNTETCITAPAHCSVADVEGYQTKSSPSVTVI